MVKELRAISTLSLMFPICTLGIVSLAPSRRLFVGGSYEEEKQPRCMKRRKDTESRPPYKRNTWLNAVFKYNLSMLWACGMCLKSWKAGKLALDGDNPAYLYNFQGNACSSDALTTQLCSEMHHDK